MIWRVAFCSLAFPATAAQAQPGRSDIQIWPALTVTTPIADGLDLRGEAVLQFTDDASHAGRELIRVMLVAPIDRHVSVAGGYTWTHVDAGPAVRFTEHRGVQDLAFRTAIAPGGVTLGLRTRLEERMQEGRSGMALRWRQQTRLDVPVGPPDGVRLVAWNEYFHSLNRTRRSGRTGPSLMLSFAGVHVPVSRRIAIEPGYLNQTQFDPGRNRVRHVGYVSVSVRL